MHDDDDDDDDDDGDDDDDASTRIRHLMGVSFILLCFPISASLISVSTLFILISFCMSSPTWSPHLVLSPPFDTCILHFISQI